MQAEARGAVTIGRFLTKNTIRRPGIVSVLRIGVAWGQCVAGPHPPYAEDRAAERRVKTRGLRDEGR